MELCGFPNQSRDYARPGQQKGRVYQRTQAENGGALSQGTLDDDSRLWVQTISADRDTASRGGDMPDKSFDVRGRTAVITGGSGHLVFDLNFTGTFQSCQYHYCAHWVARSRGGLTCC